MNKKATKSNKTRKTKTTRNNSGQWVSGQSGNPKGKKKGTVHLSTVLQKLIDKDFSATDPFTDKKSKKPLGKWLCIQLLSMGMDKDIQALKLIFERSEGKVPENINLNTGDSQSLDDVKAKVRAYTTAKIVKKTNGKKK